MKSSTDTDEPSRDVPITATVEPKRHILRTDNDAPRKAQSKIEIAEPRRETDLSDNEAASWV
jgi:hypothetical protein